MFDLMDYVTLHISSSFFTFSSFFPSNLSGSLAVLPPTLGAAGKAEGDIMCLQCFRRVVPQFSQRCGLS